VSSDTSVSSPSHDAVTPADVTPFQTLPSVRVTTRLIPRITLDVPLFVRMMVGSRCVGTRKPPCVLVPTATAARSSTLSSISRPLTSLAHASV